MMLCKCVWKRPGVINAVNYSSRLITAQTVLETGLNSLYKRIPSLTEKRGVFKIKLKCLDLAFNARLYSLNY